MKKYCTLTVFCFRYTAREIREAILDLEPRRFWNTRDAVLALLREKLSAMTMNLLLTFENTGWAGAEPDMYGVYTVRHGNATTSRKTYWFIMGTYQVYDASAAGDVAVWTNSRDSCGQTSM